MVGAHRVRNDCSVHDESDRFYPQRNVFPLGQMMIDMRLPLASLAND